MPLTPIHNPQGGPLRVVGLMSGSGTNIRKLLERQKELQNNVFQVVALFSDNAESNATTIGKEYDLPVVIRDIAGFYQARGKKRSDLSIRPEFDQGTVQALKPFNAKLAAYGGYMSIASPVLINAFLGVNVHPADLSIEKEGKRVFTGAHAVADAMKAGEKEIRATTHLVTPEVDYGQRLLISRTVPVDSNKSPDENQARLKEVGDWDIFPKTIEYVAQGRFAKDEKEAVYLDGKPIPKGIKMEELT